MATALEAAKEHLTCPLCTTNFEDPKTIMCLHTFCKKCINGHIVETVRSAIKPKGFDCPVCKKQTALSEFIGKKPEEWSELLPTNEALSNILKALNTVETGPELQCPRHKDKDVEFFCEEHEIFACSVCTTNMHKTCRSVPSITDAVRKRRESTGKLTDDLLVQITETEKILNNRQDQFEMLQRKEEEIKHEISEMRAQLNDFFSQMEGKVLDAMAEIKHKESGRIQLEINQCHQIIEKARESMRHMNELLEDKNALTIVEKYNSNLRAYEERQDIIESLYKNLSDIVVKYLANRDIEKTLCEANNIGSLSIQNTRSRLVKPDTETRGASPNLEKIIEVEEETDSGDFNTYNSSKSTKEFKTSSASIRTTEASIGTSIDEVLEDQVPNLKLQKEDEDSDPEHVHMKTIIKVRFTRDFNTTVDKQTECAVEGVTILPTGYIVLTDSYNKCLKLYDGTFKFITMSKFTILPGDVVAISDKEVVVCLPETLRIKHEKIDVKNKKLIAGEVLTVGDKCFSLSFNNRKLAACSNSTVYIFQRQGSAWVSEAKINVHVNNLKCVALDSAAERIVVTRDGFPNRSIICMTISGFKLWAFTHEEIRLPRGITFIGNKILVAVSDQKTVIQLNGGDGRLDGVLLQEAGLQWPWKLCVNAKGDKMLLSQNHHKMEARDKNRVLVFQLTKIQMEENANPRK